MKQNYIKDGLYMSTTHGPVIYKGLDHYWGETTLKFETADGRKCYWKPDKLGEHFEAEK